MRLNRVLLLAATINILIFALAFTISCSGGEDGPRGRDADHCIVDDNWDILCTSSVTGKTDLAGHLNGGEGDPGAPGDQGDRGDGCKLGEKVEGTASYQILCGPAGSEEVKGILDGCVLSFRGEAEVSITCGATSLGLCKGEAYDPETYYCDPKDGRLELDPDNDFGECGENLVKYNKKSHYCGWAEDDEKNGITEESHVYKICGSDADADQPNKDAWNKDYCRYVSEKEAMSSNEYCADGNPINKDSWKEQYCGYADKNAVSKKVLTGICDRHGTAIIRFASSGGTDENLAGFAIKNYVRGPNEIAFGQGYCEVRFEDRAKNITTYSERICGQNGRPNEKKWLNQYCGYAKFDDKIPTKVMNDMCSDGTRPGARGDFVATASYDATGNMYIDAISIASNRAYMFTDQRAINSNYLVASEGKVSVSSAGWLDIDKGDLFIPGFNGPNPNALAANVQNKNFLTGGRYAGAITVKESGNKYFCGWLNAKGTTQLPGVVGSTLMEACPVYTVDSKNNVKITYKPYNVGSWKRDYCGVKPGTIEGGNINAFGGFGGVGTPTKDVPNFLKNSYKFKDNSGNIITANLKSEAVDTLYTGTNKQAACDDKKGPFMYGFASQGLNDGMKTNQTWNGYCRYTASGTVLTTASIASNDFCGGVIIPRGSYCGLAAATADGFLPGNGVQTTGNDAGKANGTKYVKGNIIPKIYSSGVCGDGVTGPFSTLTSDNKAANFCGYTSASAKITTAIPKCSGKTFNEKSWNYEYCGFEKVTTGANPFNGAKVFKGACTFEGTALEYDFNVASSGIVGIKTAPLSGVSPINYPLNKYRIYRGTNDYLSAANQQGLGTTVTSKTGPGSFCQAYNLVSIGGATIFTPAARVDAIDGQKNEHSSFTYQKTCQVGSSFRKLNEGSWKGEYCVGSSSKIGAAAGIATGDVNKYKVLQCQGILVPTDYWDLNTKCTRPTDANGNEFVDPAIIKFKK